MIEAIVAGLFGLLIGSFLNVCIYRLPRDLSVVRPRSHCPSCEKMIAWYDNIPVVSFVLLRAKCRSCQATISWRYPLVELLTGALFSAATLWMGPTAAALKLCLFAAILIALFFSDLETLILPDEFTKGGFAAGLLIAWFVKVPGLIGLFFPNLDTRLTSVLDAALAGLGSAFVLWSVGALYARIRNRDGLGFGDVKMVAMIGVFLGLQGVLLTLMAGSTLGAVIGILYIVITRKDAATYELPFGTFLAAAALAAAVYVQ